MEEHQQLINSDLGDGNGRMLDESQTIDVSTPEGRNEFYKLCMDSTSLKKLYELTLKHLPTTSKDSFGLGKFF
jgi:hypothetical protein